MGKITIYTDGSSRGNPGPGGWGAVIIEELKGTSGKTQVREIGGREELTTNNRMEMVAAIGALSSVEAGSEVEIHTDSAYLLQGITKWVFGWQKNNWKTKEKNDVQNRDLWEQLFSLTSKMKMNWQKVTGHSGHALNDRCDEIATSFADNKHITLFSGSEADYKVSAATNTKAREGKAYSYVSLVHGVIQVHKTWSECEERVRGVKGACYRKALSPGEEKDLIEAFQNM